MEKLSHDVLSSIAHIQADIPVQFLRPTFKKLSGPHQSWEGTEEQRSNLLKLADFLFQNSKALKETDRFNMRFWNSKFQSMAEEFKGRFAEPSFSCDSCDAVACAVGWGPTAGIEVKGNETWARYSERALGLEAFSSYHWVADCMWGGRDNTPEGAAYRAYYMLEHGVPLAAEAFATPKPEPAAL
jgi:hypothetical protein